eukprot:384247_1
MSVFQSLGKIDALLTIVDKELRKSNIDKNDGLNISQNKNIICKPFGTTEKGEQVDLYILKNKNGMEVEIINYGGHIRALRVPSNKYETKSQELVDVTIGLDNIFDYEHKNRYFGSIVGRYANRICKGKFTLNGKQYKLPINNGPNSLHGGIDNFSHKVWKTTILNDKIGLSLNYVSAHMEQGFPGELNVTVEYILLNDNTLEINYRATTDSSTVLNLTNHAYFNLNGDFKSNGVADGSHLFQINANYFTPIDNTSIPIHGSLQSVINTLFDFRKLSDDLGDRINKNIESNEQIKNGNGFDHNFVLKNDFDDKIIECAVVVGKNSGIKMIVYTDQPGVQFYTSNYLFGDLYGKGKIYDKRCAFCFETQHFPDSPNQKTFPSTVLNKGDVFKSTTRFAFQTV